MDDFVDIWREFNLAFLEFMIYFQFFWLKIEIVITNAMYTHFSYNLYDEIHVIEKIIFQFGRVLFSRRETFLAKSDPAFTILLIPCYKSICMHLLLENLL